MSETDKTSDKTNASRILDILIQNSTVFSGAVSEWTQRIDKIRGVYLTALFGLIGLLLSPNVKPLKDILADIRADNTQMFLVLLLPILNSLLLVYVTSYMHFIYAAAKYNSYYLGSLVTEEIGRKIVPFDDWETTVGDKEAWVTTRSIVGFTTFALASMISVAVLYTFAEAGRMTKGTVNFVLYLLSSEMVSLSIVAGVVNHRIGGKYHVSDMATKSPCVKRQYLMSLPLCALLYLVLAWML